MEKKRKLQILNYGLMLFSFLTQTLHAESHISNNTNTSFLDVIYQEPKKKLRIGFLKPVGYEEFLHLEYNNVTNNTIVTGYCIDIFFEAVKNINLEFEFIPFIDENGKSAGNYNDLVYQIHLKKFDVVVGDVTITANRSKYVDFTVPYTDIGIGTIAKRVDHNDFWIFLRPFNKNLWLTSLGFFIFTGFIVWVVEHPSNSEFQGSPSQQIGTIFWFAFSTLVFAHRERLTKNLSKFVMIVWLFVVLILTSSYTAILTSLLTVEQIQLINIGGYIGTIGYQHGSIMQGVIGHNLNFQDYSLQPYNSPQEYADALSRGSKNGGAAAIIDELPYLKLFLAKYPDGYTLVKSTPITNGFGFAFEKGSPLVSIASKKILKLREEGQLMKIEEKWFKSKSTLVNEPDSVNKNPKTLDVYRFRGLFLITGISSTLALAIFLFYRLYTFLLKLARSYMFRVFSDELLPNTELTLRVDSSDSISESQFP